MKRREFLAELKAALENKMSAEEIQKQIAYYESYFEEEMQKGRLEEEILDELGDPWAISKTLVIANEMSGSEYYSEDEKVQTQEEQIKTYSLDSWWKIAIVVIVALVVLGALFSFAFGVLALLIRYAFPLLVIYFIYKMIKK